MLYEVITTGIDAGTIPIDKWVGPVSGDMQTFVRIIFNVMFHFKALPESAPCGPKGFSGFQINFNRDNTASVPLDEIQETIPSVFFVNPEVV